MSNLVLTIGYDSDAECPSEFDGWRLVSFGRRHVNYEDPNKWLGRTAAGIITGANVGINSKLRAGTAFILSCFEHGNCQWGLQGEVFQCQWDTAQVAGILVWEQDVGNLGPKTYKDRQQDARIFLETYTNWANGNVYGYILETEDGKDVDSCWGYYGDEDLKSAIKEAMGKEDKIVRIKGEGKDMFSLSEFEKEKP